MKEKSRCFLVSLGQFFPNSIYAIHWEKSSKVNVNEIVVMLGRNRPRLVVNPRKKAISCFCGGFYWNWKQCRTLCQRSPNVHEKFTTEQNISQDLTHRSPFPLGIFMNGTLINFVGHCEELFVPARDPCQPLAG